MTIKQFRDTVIAEKNKRDSIAAEINELLKQESVFQTEADAAAETGNVELYEEKMAEKEKAERAIFVKRNFLDKMKQTLTEDDAMKAWEGYAAEYNRKLLKARADFLAAKEKLISLYSVMVELQGEALQTRKELGAVVDLDKNTFKMDFIPCVKKSDIGSLVLEYCGCADPDAAYFLSAMAIKKCAELGLDHVPANAAFDPTYENRFRVSRIVRREI